MRYISYLNALGPLLLHCICIKFIIHYINEAVMQCIFYLNVLVAIILHHIGIKFSTCTSQLQYVPACQSLLLLKPNSLITAVELVEVIEVHMAIPV